jgi:glycosyltransferase involved in cell wall biosynthesis
MKILHILGDRKLPRDPETSASSGVVNAVLETARAQVELGHDVYVASVVGERWRTHWKGIKLLGLSPYAWARAHINGRTLDMRNHLPFAVLTRRFRFDLAIGNAYSYMRLIQAKVRMVTFHTPPRYRGRNSGVDLSISPQDYNRIATDSDAQLAVSNYVAKELREGLGNRGNVHVAYNGVEQERFSSALIEKDRLEFRRSWGVNENTTVLLYAGAIGEEKGVIHLANVFANLAEIRDDLRLVIAGGSLWKVPQKEYEASVRRILDTAEKKGYARFLGMVQRNQMPSVYAASDIVVVPSCWQEPFPLVTLEALSAGKPIIASNVGGIPETVTSDVGFLVPAGNENLLQSAILKLAGDEVLRGKLSESARKRAEAFTWTSTARVIDSVYHDVLGANRNGR